MFFHIRTWELSGMMQWKSPHYKQSLKTVSIKRNVIVFIIEIFPGKSSGLEAALRRSRLPPDSTSHTPRPKCIRSIPSPPDNHWIQYTHPRCDLLPQPAIAHRLLPVYPQKGVGSIERFTLKHGKGRASGQIGHTYNVPTPYNVTQNP